jgi:hypothetical protein
VSRTFRPKEREEIHLDSMLQKNNNETSAEKLPDYFTTLAYGC